jgi:hypothetical protein
VALGDLIAFDDVLAIYLLAGVRIYFRADAVAGVLVDLVEANFLALARRRIERNRAGDERKPEGLFRGSSPRRRSRPDG